ncbi:50S ribosomal protein L4 [Candidatus Vidania fulgoroideorum]
MLNFFKSYISNSRKIVSKQKTRGEKNYSGIKIRKQKGTGFARLGSKGSPSLKGGGRAFPNTGNENFNKKINKKIFLFFYKKFFLKSLNLKKIFFINNIFKKTYNFVNYFNNFIILKNILICYLNKNNFINLKNFKEISFLKFKNLSPYHFLKYNLIFIENKFYYENTKNFKSN